MIEIIMDGPFCREELLIGVEGLTFLSSCRVAVIGLGGVGSFAAEALARAGLGGLVLVDDDLVEESNINRQLCALRSTIGRPKAEVGLPENLKSGIFEVVFTISKKSTSPMRTLGNGLMYP